MSPPELSAIKKEGDKPENGCSESVMFFLLQSPKRKQKARLCKLLRRTVHRLAARKVLKMKRIDALLDNGRVSSLLVVFQT